jgi:hypothetical protein
MNLRSLFLQSLSGINTNPLCEEKDYRSQVLNQLMLLRRLDGIPREIAFEQGKELLKKPKKEIKFELNSSSSWYTKQYPRVESVQNVRLEGEDDLKK